MNVTGPTTGTPSSRAWTLIAFLFLGALAFNPPGKILGPSTSPSSTPIAAAEPVIRPRHAGVWADDAIPAPESTAPPSSTPIAAAEPVNRPRQAGAWAYNTIPAPESTAPAKLPGPIASASAPSNPAAPIVRPFPSSSRRPTRWNR